MNGPRMGRVGPIHADLIRADPSGPLNLGLFLIQTLPRA